MRRVLNIIFIQVLIMAFTSCESSFYRLLTRGSTPPFNDKVVCMLQKDDYGNVYGVFRCKGDENTDYYVLERAEDASDIGSLIWVEVKRVKQESGNKEVIEFRDDSIKEDKKYIYRLDKIRGGVYLKGVEFSYLYFDDEIRSTGINTTIESAIEVFDTTSCIVYDVSYFSCNKVNKERGYYKVKLPRGYRAIFRVNQVNPVIETVGSDTNLSYKIADGVEGRKVIKQGGVIEIRNEKSREDTIYFYIESSRDSMSEKVNKVAYTIKLERVSE